MSFLPAYAYKHDYAIVIQHIAVALHFYYC